jgi:hypothetical protein
MGQDKVASVRKHKRFLWALARFARGQQDPDISPLNPLLLCGLIPSSDVREVEQQQKVLFLVFSIFQPICQVFVECKFGCLEAGSRVVIPLDIGALVTEVDISMWMASAGTSYRVVQAEYTLTSLHTLTVRSVEDVSDAVMQFAAGTRLDDELALLRKMMRKSKPRRPRAKGASGARTGKACRHEGCLGGQDHAFCIGWWNCQCSGLGFSGRAWFM